MVQVSDPRIVWWLNARPTLTTEWLADDAIKQLIKTCSNVVSYLDSDREKVPAPVQGWVGHKLAMCVYGSLVCQEWRLNRAGGDTWFWEFAAAGKELVRRGDEFKMPPWFEDEHLMQSHWSAAKRHGALEDDVAVPWAEVDEYWPVLWPVITEDGYELRVNKADKAAMEVDDLWLPDNVRARVVNL
jgi:hypothetical protein